jgi:acyl carrier protein
LVAQSTDEVLAGVLEIMGDLAGQWEYSGPLSPDTRMLADMEMKSLDFVILATAVVKRYGIIPFDQFYTQLSDVSPEEREVTVRQFVDFVCAHLRVPDAV